MKRMYDEEWIRPQVVYHVANSTLFLAQFNQTWSRTSTLDLLQHIYSIKNVSRIYLN
jgi:hypothetical protein